MCIFVLMYMLSARMLYCIELDYRMGVDVVRGEMGDVSTLGINEAFKVKQQILLSATEAAECILRVDDVIRAAPRQRQ